MNIGATLKKLLEDSGQRQAAVAKKIGYEPANMSRALTKGYNLTMAAAFKIADGIGLDIFLLDSDGNRRHDVNIEQFVDAVSKTRMQWNDAEALLASIGYFIEFDWR